MGRIRFDTASSWRHRLRGVRWGAAWIGAIGISALVLWWWWRAPGNGPAPRPAAEALPTAAVHPGAPAEGGHPPPAAAAALPASPPGSPPGSATAPEQTLEVCGLGIYRGVHRERDAERDIERLFPQAVIDAARERVTTALLAGSEREQVVGLLLRRTVPLNAQQATMRAVCGTDGDCYTRHHRQAPAPALQAIHQALATLARNSRDPWVYATVFTQVCAGMPPPMGAGALCEGLTAQGWAERDPDNAAPWMWLAQAAAEQRDAAAEHAAWAAAAERAAHRPYFATSHAVLQAQAAFREQPAPVRFVLNAEGWGYSAAMPIPYPMPFRRHCAAEQLAAPERRAVCESLVKHLSSDNAVLSEHFLAARVAEGLAAQGALPQREAQRLADERVALQMAHSAHFSPEQLLSCRGMAFMRRYEDDLAASGEVGAMRRVLAGTGQALEVWAAKGHAARAQAERAASAALAAAADGRAGASPARP